MARPISFDPEAALEQAVDLFWTRGYHDVSVEDIVQATGLNRHSLYARYGSKLGLLQAAVDRYRETVLDRIRRILAAPDSARDKIRRLLMLRSEGGGDEFFESMLDRGCFAVRISNELRNSHEEFRRVVNDFGDAVEAMLTDVVRQGQQRGEIRSDRTAEDLAAVLIGGFMLPLLLSSRGVKADAFVAVLD